MSILTKPFSGCILTLTLDTSTPSDSSSSLTSTAIFTSPSSSTIAESSLLPGGSLAAVKISASSDKPCHSLPATSEIPPELITMPYTSFCDRFFAN